MVMMTAPSQSDCENNLTKYCYNKKAPTNRLPTNQLRLRTKCINGSGSRLGGINSIKRTGVKTFNIYVILTLNIYLLKLESCLNLIKIIILNYANQSKYFISKILYTYFQIKCERFVGGQNDRIYKLFI